MSEHGGRFIDRTGQTYGDLTVLSFSRKNDKGQSFWMDMAAKYGISAMGLRRRLESGMSLESALTTPVDKKMWNWRNKCAS